MVDRLSSIKCDILSLKQGEFVVKDGWNPNCVKTPYGEVGRANVIGVVVALNGMNEFVLDDSTEKITVRSFDKQVPVLVGDIITVIGRPREFNQERYLYPEIIKKTNKGWVEFRKKELDMLRDPRYIAPVKVDAVKEEPIEITGNIYDVIITKLKEMDAGTGVMKNELLSVIGNNNEYAVQKLLEEGEIFESSPGKLKVLE